MFATMKQFALLPVTALAEIYVPFDRANGVRHIAPQCAHLRAATIVLSAPGFSSGVVGDSSSSIES